MSTSSKTADKSLHRRCILGHELYSVIITWSAAKSCSSNVLFQLFPVESAVSGRDYEDEAKIKYVSHPTGVIPSDALFDVCSGTGEDLG
jgi:hypothetical protein